MSRLIAMVILAAGIMLLLSSCGEPEPTPYQHYCSISGDGSNYIAYDNRLKIDTLGKPFYVSDNMVFNLGNVLYSHPANSGGQNIIAFEQITDKQHLAIDRQNHRLYYAAENAIYQVGFYGENPVKISPDGAGFYSAPVLSPDGRYLTAIRAGRIVRRDMYSGEWVEVEAYLGAFYASYASDEDAYYYYAVQPVPDSYQKCISFCRINPHTLEKTILMEGYASDSTITNNNIETQISPNGRYFTMQLILEPISEVNWWDGSNNWIRYTTNLYIYDRINHAITTIPMCFSHSFVAGTGDLLYSHWGYGMADMMKLSLPAGNSIRVWDGYSGKNLYSWSISRIYPRDDGNVIFMDAWSRGKKDPETKSIPTAP